MNKKDVAYLSISISTMKYYSAVKKKNEIFPFAKTWMNLQGIMLSEISQIEKDKCCMLSLQCGTKKKKKIQQTSEYNKKKETEILRTN